MNTVRRLAVCAGFAVGSVLTPVAIASAAVTVPFQVDPAPFGNPNGSFDAPAVRCVAVVGEQPGTVTITGGKDGGWGCLLSSEVRWLNLSTGASGSSWLSDGLNGVPAAATLQTGPGQIAVALLPGVAGPITPGVATFSVP
ncbi:hypothetical protein EGT67_16125 [Prescottella agglutinans]|uniref:Secreted protein n=1 Tax=Prescottella agglutinans TaxID=1644129 RepID=A0A3S3AES8_9NOCA|nr:hypothetical protein [Prescottella agglutinans]RVW08447.1 hypothetical protein EGT67_16125 [Prescottella agglutinans]